MLRVPVIVAKHRLESPDATDWHAFGHVVGWGRRPSLWPSEAHCDDLDTHWMSILAGQLGASHWKPVCVFPLAAEE